MQFGVIPDSAEARPQRSTATLPATVAGAPIGIGSLPFHSAAEAMQAVAEHCPEVPFWPQLPQMSVEEGVIGQGLGVLAGLVEPRSEGYGYQVKAGRIDAVVEALHTSSGCLTSTHAAGFAAFEHALKLGVFGSALAVKGQIEGPITLAACLFHRSRAFLADAPLFAAVAFHIAQIACWQIDRLRAMGRPVMLFIDEPALCLDDAVPDGISQEPRLSALSAIFDDIRARGALAGLHCCAARPFARMFLAKPDILSFDADEGLEEFFADSRAHDFVDRGGWVAYGIVPNSSSLDAAQPSAIFSRWLMAASMAGDPQALARRTMISATCGLGLRPVSAVSRSFHMARQVGGLVRRLAGLEAT